MFKPIKTFQSKREVRCLKHKHMMFPIFLESYNQNYVNANEVCLRLRLAVPSIRLFLFVSSEFHTSYTASKRHDALCMMHDALCTQMKMRQSPATSLHSESRQPTQQHQRLMPMLRCEAGSLLMHDALCTQMKMKIENASCHLTSQ
jgi:hypothetical protein